MKSTDVLIVGAGPTGLMLANQLQKFGTKYIIVDVKKGPTDQSRALAVSARSMELYQQLNLSDQIVQDSTELIGFKIFSNGKQKATVNLENLGKNLSDFPNFMNAYEQNKNETLLYKNIRDHGHDVLWQHGFIELTQKENHVSAQLKTIDTNESMEIEAAYIVGCDGAKSPVRHAVNLKFEGGTYENKFFVVDTKIEWQLPYNNVILCPSDFQFITFFPLKGEGGKNMRVIGTLPSSFNEKDGIDIEELEQIIKKTTKIDLNFVERGWNSIYRIHHRSVNSFRKGRIFLAGDSAHVHSPAGGQGMNTGLQDAHNLAWKLAYVIKGQGKDSLLESYNEERLPIAETLLNSTDKGFTFLAGDGFWLRLVRKTILIPFISILLKINGFRRFAFKKISQIDYSYYRQSHANKTSLKFKFKVGDRIPYISPGFYKNFQSPNFFVLHVGQQALNESQARELKTHFPIAVEIVESKRGKEWKALGVSNEIFLVIRPDQYISMIFDKIEGSAIKKHFGQHFKYR